jgi:protease-4
MKTFFTSFFGAVVGVIVSSILIVVIAIAAIVGGIGAALSKTETKKETKNNSVLFIDFKQQINDRTLDNPFSNFSFDALGEKRIGLDKIVENIQAAKKDSNIKGIYLHLTSIEAGIAAVEEIRNTLLDFKKSNKFIYAYSEMYNQKSYYLASVADKILLNPQGDFDFKGLSAQIMFFKKALDNLQVDVQIFRHGKFKSAIEPFMLDKMSESNRLQTEQFLGSIWNNMLTQISKERKITVDELNVMADELKINSPDDAFTNKLVDGLTYDDEAKSIIRKKLAIEATGKINFIKIADYEADKSILEDKFNDKKIAVIYAVGSIESGEGDDETIGSDRIASAIKEARLDERIKAIVLRVNSPGGSALASDVIWREVTLAKKAKPFIVSMGDVAASGGYYISCAADRVFAQPNTITGSIGVFGIMPNAQKMLSEKLGITIDTVNTNKHSDMGGIFRGVTENERAKIQNSVENVYDVFTKRVAEGRKMKQSDVDSIGQGRVWSGTDALKIKLVDELGGLDKAIEFAAKKSNTSDYSIIQLPKVKNPIEELFNDIEKETEAKVIKNQLGDSYKYLRNLKTIINLKGVQARMPYDLIIY